MAKLSALIANVQKDPEITDDEKRSLISELLDGKYDNSEFGKIERDVTISEADPSNKPGGILKGAQKSLVRGVVGVKDLPSNLVKLTGTLAKAPGGAASVASAISSLLLGENKNSAELDRFAKEYNSGVDRATNTIASNLPSESSEVMKRLEYQGTGEMMGGIGTDILSLVGPGLAAKIAGIGLRNGKIAPELLQAVQSLGGGVDKAVNAAPIANLASKGLSKLGKKVASSTGGKFAGLKAAELGAKTAVSGLDNALITGATEALKTGDLDKAKESALVGGALGGATKLATSGVGDAAKGMLRTSIGDTIQDSSMAKSIRDRLLKSDKPLDDLIKEVDDDANWLVEGTIGDPTTAALHNPVNKGKAWGVVEKGLKKQEIPSLRFGMPNANDVRANGAYIQQGKKVKIVPPKRYTTEYEDAAKKVKNWMTSLTGATKGSQMPGADLFKGLTELADNPASFAKMMPEGDQTIPELVRLMKKSNPFAGKTFEEYLDLKATSEALKRIQGGEKNLARSEGIATGRVMSALRSGISPGKVGYGLTAAASPKWISSSRYVAQGANKLDKSKFLDEIIRKVGMPFYNSNGRNQ